MSKKSVVRILLVEDSPSELALVRETFAEASDTHFELTHVTRLAEALEALAGGAFDAVLLDLGLPDSQGVETFVQLHRCRPDVPIVVHTASDDSSTAENTLRRGAEDYFFKRREESELLRQSVRFAVLRAEARFEREARQQLDQQSREIEGMDRLSASNATAVTARIYGGNPLRESAPDEYRAAVAEYFDLLDVALDHRIFRTAENDCSERLRELGLQLGFLRAGPRDVVEIHADALKKRLRDIPAAKAQAYLEEARVTALELMGNLTSYYRSIYAAPLNRGSKSI